MNAIIGIVVGLFLAGQILKTSYFDYWQSSRDTTDPYITQILADIHNKRDFETVLEIFNLTTYKRVRFTNLTEDTNRIQIDDKNHLREILNTYQRLEEIKEEIKTKMLTTCYQNSPKSLTRENETFVMCDTGKTGLTQSQTLYANGTILMNFGRFTDNISTYSSYIGVEFRFPEMDFECFFKYDSIIDCAENHYIYIGQKTHYIKQDRCRIYIEYIRNPYNIEITF